MILFRNVLHQHLRNQVGLPAFAPLQPHAPGLHLLWAERNQKVQEVAGALLMMIRGAHSACNLSGEGGTALQDHHWVMMKALAPRLFLATWHRQSQLEPGPDSTAQFVIAFEHPRRGQLSQQANASPFLHWTEAVFHLLQTLGASQGPRR